MKPSRTTAEEHNPVKYAEDSNFPVCFLPPPIAAMYAVDAADVAKEVHLVVAGEQARIALWMLRAFDSTSSREALFRDNSYTDDEIASFLGLPSAPAAEEPETIRRMMKGVLA